VVHNLFNSYTMVQSCLQGGHGISENEGPETTASFSLSLISLSLQSVLLAKRMWLKWN